MKAEIGAPPSDGSDSPQDWVIESSETVNRSNEIICITGNLFVKGVLHLSSVDLRFNCSSDGEFTLTVAEGGALYADFTSLSSVNSSFRFKVEIFGKLDLSYSTVKNAWGDADTRVGGIQVYGDDVSIEGCTFSDMTTAVYVYRATPYIANNTISNCIYGIVCDSETILSLPDFVVAPSSISFSPQEPKAGMPIDISVPVRNIGGRAALATVRFYDGNPSTGGSLISCEQTAMLGINETRTFIVTWTSVSGDHEIYAFVDQDRTVPEISDSNNMDRSAIRPLFVTLVQKHGDHQFKGGESYLPLGDIPVYAFKPSGEFTSISGITNPSGLVALSLPSGSYKLRADYLGYQFWSDAVALPSDPSTNITVEHKQVNVTVTPMFAGAGTGQWLDVPVYAFTENGGYIGMVEHTQYENLVLFDLPDRAYRFRVDYLGYQFWSDPVTWNDATVFLWMAKANVTVRQGDTLLPNVPVYAFKTDDTYMGLSNVTGQDGLTEFLLTGNSYKFRADFNGHQYWSGNISLVANTTIPVEIDVDGAWVNISVEKGDGTPLTGVNVYAFAASGSYIGLFNTTNETGTTALRLSAGQFMFRADYLDYQFWSEMLSVPENSSATISIPHESITVSVQKNLTGTLTPLGNIPVYLFSTGGAYLGLFGETNSTGEAGFNLPDGMEYLFRADYLGYHFWSDNFYVTEALTVTIAIDHYRVTATVTNATGESSNPIAGVPVYLYASFGAYMGMSDNTNETGEAVFELPSQAYFFKTDYLGQRYESGVVLPPKTSCAKIIIYHYIIDVNVLGDYLESQTAFSSVPVYVFGLSIPSGGRSDPAPTYLGLHSVTNETGVAQFALPSGWYKFRGDYLGYPFWSDAVYVYGIPEQSASIQINEGLGRIFVHDNSSALANVTVYAFTEAGTYLGMSGPTNESGYFEFLLPAENYKFRADYGGNQHWSTAATIIHNDTVDFDINASTGGRSRTSYDFNFQLTKNSELPLALVNVYVFTSSGSYTGIYGTTNASGGKTFSLSDGTFKFRADYMGYQFWSENASIPSDLNLTMNIPHYSVTVNVSKLFNGTSSPITSVNVYLFTSGGSYMGKSGTTNSSGMALFEIPEKEYKFRVDYLGNQFWSNITLPTENLTLDVVIEHRDVSIQVLRNYLTDQIPVNSATVYLYTPGASYMGQSKVTNVTGSCSFVLPNKSYMFRADYLSFQFWSPATAWNDTTVLIDEGKINVTVKDGDIILSSVNVYLFSQAGSYLGKSGATGPDGIAEFQVPAGKAYRFRADYSSNQYWSGNVTPSSNNITAVDINTQGVLFTFTLLKNIDSAIAGVPVYVFTEGGNYIGLSNTTNVSGIATFRLSSGRYMFRADYLGYMHWSGVVSVPDVLTLDLTIVHRDVSVSVNANYTGTLTPLSNVTVYLYTSSGSIMPRSETTNFSGIAVFSLPEKAYRFRADYLNHQYWSDNVTWAPAEIVVAEGRLNLTFQKGSIPVQGGHVYVYTSSGTYLGISSVTGPDGTVEFQLPEGSYKLRADYNTFQYWTGNLSVTNHEILATTLDIGPDLRIAAITVIPSPARVSQYVKLTANITNAGLTTSDEFVVRFYLGDPDNGGTQLGIDEPVNGIYSGENALVSIWWMGGDPGNYAIYIRVDATNTVDESDETNNNAQNSLLIVADDRVPTLIGNSLTNCTYGFYLDHSSPALERCTMEGCGYSVYCIAASPVIINCTISAPLHSSVTALADSTPILMDTMFARAFMDIRDTSSVDVLRTFGLNVIDKQGTQIQGAQVTITSCNGTQASSISTDEHGWVMVPLREFRQDSSSCIYSSPYWVTVDYGGAHNEFWIVMDSTKTFHIFVGGDSDGDTISDTSENSRFTYPIEAENHVFSQTQNTMDPMASNGESLVAFNSNPELVNESLMSIPAGKFRLFIFARTNESVTNCTISISASINGSSVHVSPSEFQLHPSGDFRWFATSPFNTTNGTFNLTISQENENAYIDRLMLVQTAFENETSTGVSAVTDPLSKDTDNDFLDDGTERRADTIWLEAEDYANGTIDVVRDWNMSNSAVAALDDLETLYVNTSFSIPDGNHSVYVRAGASKTAMEYGIIPNITIDIDDAESSHLVTDFAVDLTSDCGWAETPRFAASGALRIAITANVPLGEESNLLVDSISIVRNREPVASLWISDTGSAVTNSSAAIWNNLVFIGTADGNMRALHASDGSSAWTFATGGAILSSPKVVNDRLLFGSSDCRLYCLNAENGTELWNFSTGEAVQSSPAIAESLVVIGSDSGYLFCLNLSDGGLVWNYSNPPRQPFRSSPAITAGLVFIGGDDNTFYCLNLSTGTLQWIFNGAGGAIVSSPLLVDGMVIFGSCDGVVYALPAVDPNGDGSIPATEIIWSSNLGSLIMSSPTVFENKVYVGAEDGNLYCLYENNGTKLWNASTGDAVQSSPAIANGLVFVGSNDSRLHAFDAEGQANGVQGTAINGGGDLIWEFDAGGNVTSSPAIDDVDGDGQLEAVIGTETGFIIAVNGAGAYYSGNPWAGAGNTQADPWPSFRKAASNTGNAQVMPKYIPTDPMNPDTDFDMLRDGMETAWYYPSDRVENEDYFMARNQEDHQFSLSLNASQPNTKDVWELLRLPITSSGHYRITLAGTGDVKIAGGVSEEQATLLDEQFQFILNAANISLFKGDNLTYLLNSRYPRLWPTYENRTWHYIQTKMVGPYPQVSRFWFYQGEFDLGAGEYTINISVNQSPFNLPLPAPSMLNISMDYLNVERLSIDPLNWDSDADSLSDGLEVNTGCYPLNPDADEDGLSDSQELKYGTSPDNKDTDFDGLRDRIELGLTGETDEYTVYDIELSQGSRFEMQGRNLAPVPSYIPPPKLSNNDTDAGLTTTDPLKRDTDADGLPDGCVDGWSYNATRDEWGLFNETSDTDNLHNFWEGEDLDLDGAVDAGLWNNGMGPGETNGSKADSDTDNLPDGWECWYSINPLSTLGDDGSSGNPDNMASYNAPWNFTHGNWTQDNLLNYEEYIVCANPRIPDTDYDSALDGAEGSIVIMRTSVTDGGISFRAYENADLSNMIIWFHGKTYQYNYEINWTEALGTGSRFGGLAANTFIKFFDERSFIFLNTTSNEISVTSMKQVGSVAMFHAYVFIYGWDSDPQTVPANRHREVYLTDPASPNSDGTFLSGRVDLANGIPDGQEPYWNSDNDSDGIVNARDIDSDDDGIQDTEEGGWGEWGTDLEGDGLCNMLDTDSDADGKSDHWEYQLKGTVIPQYDPGSNVSSVNLYCNPPYDPDSDDDGLIDGYSVTVATSDYRYEYFNSHNIANTTNYDGTVTFYGELDEGTNWSDPDSDHDKLVDGKTRTVEGKGTYYGEKSIGTSPINPDTDGDTIIDGDEVYGWTYYIEDLDGNRVPRQGHSDPRTGYTDSDSDGILDKDEFMVSDGSSVDSDSDGLFDHVELTVGTCLVDQDSDDDYLPDGWIDINQNGVPDPGEYENKDCDSVIEANETDPASPDTDNDGVDDGVEVRIIRFRTNAVNHTYNESGTWIAADTGGTSMWVYWYTNTTAPYGETVQLNYATPEGYGLVLYNFSKKILWVNASGAWYLFSIPIEPWQSNMGDADVSPHPTLKYWTRENGTGLSNPRTPFSDDDGLNDWEEIYNLSDFDTLYLKNMDPDKDGLWNAYDIDSDDDGIRDESDLFWKVNGTWWNATWMPFWWNDFDGDGLPNALDWDSDADGQADGYEDNNTNGKFEPWTDRGNPLGNDSDYDGINDTVEIAWGMDAYNNSDEDGDGILDGFEKGWSRDSDGDGRINALDPDSDGDGLLDGNNLTLAPSNPLYTAFLENNVSNIDNHNGTHTFIGEGWHGTDMCSRDSDRDGLWDGYSPNTTVNYTGWMRLGNARFYVLDGKPYGAYRNVNISGFDVRAYGELSFGTDPLRADTDNDSLTDGEEVCGYHLDDSLVPSDDWLTGSPELNYGPSWDGFEIGPGSWITMPLAVDTAGTYTLSIRAMATGTFNPQANISVNINTTPEINYFKQFYGLNNFWEMDYYPYEIHSKTADGTDLYSFRCNVPLGCLDAGVYTIQISAKSGLDALRIIRGISVLRQGLDPADNDTDWDDLNDDFELKTGTSPFRDDTDRDDEFDAGDDYPTERDVDGDKLTYPCEKYFGTDPLESDTDADLLDDYSEVKKYKTEPLVADTDSDGLIDGLEVQGWNSVVINDPDAYYHINEILKKEVLIKSGTNWEEKRMEQIAKAMEYFAIAWTNSDPLVQDTDADGLNDYREMTCSTNARNKDSDGDSMFDGMGDDEPTLYHAEPPKVSIEMTGWHPVIEEKPGGIGLFSWVGYRAHVTVVIKDETGILGYWITASDRTEYIKNKSFIKEKETGGTLKPLITESFEVKYKASGALRAPSVLIDAWDNASNHKYQTKKLWMGAMDYLEKGTAELARYLGPEAGGLASGYVVSMDDLAFNTMDMFDKIGSGENLANLRDVFGLIGQHEFLSQTTSSVLEKAKELNPYDYWSQRENYDKFIEWFKGGYLIGFIVQTVIIAIIAPEIVGALLRPVAEAMTATEVGTQLARIATTMSKFEVVQIALKANRAWGALGAIEKNVILASLQVAAYGIVKWAFPEIFDKWQKAGWFGAGFLLVSLMNVPAETKLSPAVVDRFTTTLSQNKYRGIIRPQDITDFQHFVDMGIRDGKFTVPQVTKWMEKIEDIVPLERYVQPVEMARLAESAMSKWGNNFDLVDNVLNNIPSSWSQQGKWAYSKIIAEFGPGSQLVNDILNLKSVSRVDLVVENLGRTVGTQFAKGHVYELRFASKLKASGSTIHELNYYRYIEFTDIDGVTRTARLDIDIFEVTSSNWKSGNEVKDVKYLSGTKEIRNQVLKLEAATKKEIINEGRIIVKNGHVSQPLLDFAKSKGVKIFDDAFNLLNP